jgi:hypothetical protein
MAVAKVDYSMVPISKNKILFYNDDKYWKYDQELKELITNVSIKMTEA